MLLEVFIILFLVFGWQHLGRDVSTDAFEIAKAFGAPLLQGGSSNDTVDNLVAKVGEQRVRYGEVNPITTITTGTSKPILPMVSAANLVEDIPLDDLLQVERHDGDYVSETELLSSVDHVSVVGEDAISDGLPHKLEFREVAQVRRIRTGITY